MRDRPARQRRETTSPFGAALDAVRENGVAGLSPRQIISVTAGSLVVAALLFVAVYAVLTLSGGFPLL